MTELSQRDVLADVAKAKLECKDYIDQLIAESDRKRSQRKVPVLALCGPGRCGKDLGADWLGHNFCVDYGGSLSEIVAPLIGHVLGKSTEQAFAERHADRIYWFRFCNNLRLHDPRFLVRLLLAKADIIVGIRGAIELEACGRDGLIDLAVWINKPDIKADPTIEYESVDCDITIDNTSGKLAYFNKLNKLANTLGLPPRQFRVSGADKAQFLA